MFPPSPLIHPWWAKSLTSSSCTVGKGAQDAGVFFFSVPSEELQASWPTLQETTDSLQPDPTCSLHQEWNIDLAALIGCWQAGKGRKAQEYFFKGDKWKTQLLFKSLVAVKKLRFFIYEGCNKLFKSMEAHFCHRIKNKKGKFLSQYSFFFHNCELRFCNSDFLRFV